MMANTIKTILYSQCESSCSFRARIVLNLKNVPHKIRPIALYVSKTGGEQHTNEYRAINPMGFVPALQIDGKTLIESHNIMYYLEETRPEVRLIPEDAEQRIKMREICDIIISGIQPLQNACVLYRLSDDRRKQIEWAQFYITKGFNAIEKLLQSCAKKYCVGNEISLADCCLVPQAHNARTKYEVDLTQFPTIKRIDDELRAHPAFEAAHPWNQTDYVAKAKM